MDLLRKRSRYNRSITADLKLDLARSNLGLKTGSYQKPFGRING